MLAVVGALAQEAGFTLPGLVSRYPTLTRHVQCEVDCFYQPTGSNQVDVFWECVDRNPGPIAAAIIFLGIVEGINEWVMKSTSHQLLSVHFSCVWYRNNGRQEIWRQSPWRLWFQSLAIGKDRIFKT